MSPVQPVRTDDSPRRVTVRSAAPLVTTVAIKNYKSISACEVPLQPLTFLIGPNGSGKSNFLDALRFVGDALRTSLDHAVRDRGGVNEVRRRSYGRPRHFGMRLDFVLGRDVGHYAFSIADEPNGAYRVQSEECLIRTADTFAARSAYRVENGRVQVSTEATLPPATRDRLFLVAASSLPAFRPVYDALSRMGFYNLNPDEIRDLQPPDPGDLLARDGRNIASVWGRLTPDTRERVEEYLAKVVPGVTGVGVQRVGPKETLSFRQQVDPKRKPLVFQAVNMSDGTLRALGILVALFQAQSRSRPPAPLIGIEEPEVALHPAAVAVILGALRSATRRTQVIVTSHSPDLLDTERIASDEILGVQSRAGATEIAPIDDVGRRALRRRLYTAGELLRMGQLRPDVTKIPRSEQLELFDTDSP